MQFVVDLREHPGAGEAAKKLHEIRIGSDIYHPSHRQENNIISCTTGLFWIS